MDESDAQTRELARATEKRVEPPDVWDEELYQLLRGPAIAALKALRRRLPGSLGSPESIERELKQISGSAADHERIEGLEDLISGILARRVAAKKFMMPDVEDLSIENLIVHEIASVPLSLAAEAAGRTNDVDDDVLLRSLCAEQLKYILNEDPRVDVVVPILGVRFEATDSLDRYEIIEMSTEMKRRFRESAQVSRHDAISLDSASHALRIPNVSCTPGGYGEYFVASADATTSDLIARFFQALVIILPGRATHAQLGFFPRGWSANLTDPAKPYVYLLREYGFRIAALSTQDPGEVSRDALNGATVLANALSASHPSVRVAARRLLTSYDRDTDEDRIVDLSIALEAILGSGFSETVHRISLRAAALLSLAGWANSKTTYNAMKSMYGYRSRVVHGTPGPHKQDLLKIDGVPIHASRFALAALCSLLELVLKMDDFHPGKIDDEFIFAAFDSNSVLPASEADLEDAGEPQA
jgi:hypothetical protein